MPPLVFVVRSRVLPVFELRERGRGGEREDEESCSTTEALPEPSSTSPSSFFCYRALSSEVSGFKGTRIRTSSSSRSSVSLASIPTRRRATFKVIATPDPVVELPLTAENVESILDEVRPYLMADGGNMAFHEIDANIVRLKLQGTCGSCPSSVTTMKLGIERHLMEKKSPEIVAVEPRNDEETDLELTKEKIVKVLDER